MMGQVRRIRGANVNAAKTVGLVSMAKQVING